MPMRSKHLQDGGSSHGVQKDAQGMLDITSIQLLIACSPFSPACACKSMLQVMTLCDLMCPCAGIWPELAIINHSCGECCGPIVVP